MFGRKRRARLAHENAALREALDWYATTAHWRKRGTNPKGTTPRTWTKSPAAFDRGAKAKFTLTQLDSYQPRSLLDRWLDMVLGPESIDPYEISVPKPLAIHPEARPGTALTYPAPPGNADHLADALMRRSDTE